MWLQQGLMSMHLVMVEKSVIGERNPKEEVFFTLQQRSAKLPGLMQFKSVGFHFCLYFTIQSREITWYGSTYEPRFQESGLNRLALFLGRKKKKKGQYRVSMALPLMYFGTISLILIQWRFPYEKETGDHCRWPSISLVVTVTDPSVMRGTLRCAALSGRGSWVQLVYFSLRLVIASW